MAAPTLPAPQTGIADLLAGTIDLAPRGAPPHRPGPCTALCVPTCTGSEIGAAAAPPTPGEHRRDGAEHDGGGPARNL